MGAFNSIQYAMKNGRAGRYPDVGQDNGLHRTTELRVSEWHPAETTHPICQRSTSILNSNCVYMRVNLRELWLHFKISEMLPRVVHWVACQNETEIKRLTFNLRVGLKSRTWLHFCCSDTLLSKQKHRNQLARRAVTRASNAGALHNPHIWFIVCQGKDII